MFKFQDLLCIFILISISSATRYIVYVNLIFYLMGFDFFYHKSFSLTSFLQRHRQAFRFHKESDTIT